MLFACMCGFVFAVKLTSTAGKGRRLLAQEQMIPQWSCRVTKLSDLTALLHAKLAPAITAAIAPKAAREGATHRCPHLTGTAWRWVTHPLTLQETCLWTELIAVGCL